MIAFVSHFIIFNLKWKIKINTWTTKTKRVHCNVMSANIFASFTSSLLLLKCTFHRIRMDYPSSRINISLAWNNDFNPQDVRSRNSKQFSLHCHFPFCDGRILFQFHQHFNNFWPCHHIKCNKVVWKNAGMFQKFNK